MQSRAREVAPTRACLKPGASSLERRDRFVEPIGPQTDHAVGIFAEGALVDCLSFVGKVTRSAQSSLGQAGFTGVQMRSSETFQGRDLKESIANFFGYDQALLVRLPRRREIAVVALDVSERFGRVAFDTQEATLPRRAPGLGQVLERLLGFTEIVVQVAKHDQSRAKRALVIQNAPVVDRLIKNLPGLLDLSLTSPRLAHFVTDDSLAVPIAKASVALEGTLERRHRLV